MVTQISQADAQVVIQSVGDADGEAETEQTLRHAERIEVAVAAEQRARDCFPHQLGRGEHEVRQVGQHEEHGAQRAKRR